jgi:predicted nucleic acid-binding protein
MASASGAAGLIDTDILIDGSRGRDDAVAFLTTEHATVGIHISIISAMELIAGCRSAGELRQVQQFLQQVTILPVSATISQSAHQLMESFFLSHRLLIPDSLIAATALNHGLTLYTKNTRHFKMIPDIRLVRPY